MQIEIQIAMYNDIVVEILLSISTNHKMQQLMTIHVRTSIHT